MKPLFRLSLFFVAILACGCASVRTFKVDAIAASTPIPGRVYHIIPANPQVPASDLRFIEAANIVEQALAARGYKRVADTAAADLIVAVDATVGPPENVAIARSEPIFDDVGGFYFTANVPVRNRAGRMCHVRTSVWSPPHTRMIGIEENVYTSTFYEKRLALTAFVNAEDTAQDLPQLWSVVVVSRGENSDLRAALPMMAVAAARHIESDTKGQVTLRINASDPEVIRVSPAKAEAK